MLNDHVKTLIGIMAKRISTHLEEQSLLPAEQKGCPPGSKGCTDQYVRNYIEIKNLQIEYTVFV
jgi:hypothetical protein